MALCACLWIGRLNGLSTPDIIQVQEQYVFFTPSKLTAPPTTQVDMMVDCKRKGGKQETKKKKTTKKQREGSEKERENITTCTHGGNTKGGS